MLRWERNWQSVCDLVGANNAPFAGPGVGERSRVGLLHKNQSMSAVKSFHELTGRSLSRVFALSTLAEGHF